MKNHDVKAHREQHRLLEAALLAPAGLPSLWTSQSPYGDDAATPEKNTEGRAKQAE